MLWAGAGERETVRVLCTQPRRIAAVSLARRVAIQQKKVLASCASPSLCSLLCLVSSCAHELRGQRPGPSLMKPEPFTYKKKPTFQIARARTCEASFVSFYLGSPIWRA